MKQKNDEADALDLRAAREPSLAKSQAMAAQADRLRRLVKSEAWTRLPIFRN